MLGTLSILGILSVGLPAVAADAPDASRVRVKKLPGGGIQPQAVVDPQGVVHVVYLAGEPGGCDVFYTRLGPDDAELAWAESTGWQRGGALAWRAFDSPSRPTEAKGRVDGGIPVWGLAAAVTCRDGAFLIIH